MLCTKEGAFYAKKASEGPFGVFMQTLGSLEYRGDDWHCRLIVWTLAVLDVGLPLLEDVC